MWKSAFSSRRLSMQHSSSQSLPDMVHTATTTATKYTSGDDDDEDDSASVSSTASHSRRLFFRRLSLPTVSRPQWGKRLQHCISQRVMKGKEGENSISWTNSTEEESSIRSNLSTASSTSLSSLIPSPTSLTKRHRPLRCVRFSVVQVREFDRTIGENPACKAGPPLSLDWSFVEHPEEWICDAHLVPEDLNVQDDVATTTATTATTKAYHHPKIKRTLQQLYISAERRIELLRDEWDVTESEMAASMQVVDQIKKSREHVVTEFRQLLALKRQQQQQEKEEDTKRTDNEKEANTDFEVTRVEC